MRFIIFTFIFIIVFVSIARAAELSIIGKGEAAVGAQYAVDIVADTDAQAINSVQANIFYPAELLEFAGYQDAAGVVKLWVVAPKATTPGTVTFVGGVPGGVDGMYRDGQKSQNITIVQLLFTPKTAGQATMSIGESLLLLNDGKATELAHDRQGMNVAITGEASVGESPTAVDTEPPMPFALTFIPPNEEGNAPAMLAFSAFDAQTGIREYRMKLGWGAWRAATSPQPIPKRMFSYRAKVTAVDGAGNERQASLRIKGMFPTSALVIVLLIALASVWKIFMIKKKV